MRRYLVALLLALSLFVIGAAPTAGGKPTCKPRDCPTPTPAPTPTSDCIAFTTASDVAAVFAQAMSQSKPACGAAGRYELTSAWPWGGGSGFAKAFTLLCAGCVFDGNGGERFLYMGAPFRGEGFRLEGFRPVDTGMLGALAGATTYTLRDVTIIGPNVYNPNGHGVYITAAGTVLIERLTTSGVGGGAVHIYNGEVAVPGLTTTIRDSSLHSLHVNLIADEGSTTVVNTRFNGPTEGHVREGGSGSVSLSGSCYTEPGSQYNIGPGNISGTLGPCP